MIIVYDKEQPDSKPLTLNVIDTHTHLGKEEVVRGKGKDYRIIRPKDHLDFYEKLKFDVFQRITAYP
ncbi:MAG: hypothetical protein KAJ76_06320, partial [Candidatus Heimdallarchaeota archaeon]|nr:hypothetical protein [Candidatus Heimdallarchaeota archaeon]